MLMWGASQVLSPVCMQACPGSVLVTLKSNGQVRKAHIGDRHDARHDADDRHALKGLRNVAVVDALADAREDHDRDQIADRGADAGGLFEVE